MMVFARWKAWSAAAVVAVGAMVLAACMVTPGAFDATLDLRRDGRFTFTYNGEIYLLALGSLADMAEKAEAANAEFELEQCWDDDSFEERECSEDEIASQRAEWEAKQEADLADKKRESEAMRAMLGGIDPSDPDAAEELAARMRRQKGWKKVEYRGDGLFDVEFEITSRLGYDFAFPTFERFPMSNSFVIANLREGNVVRIEAPGFAAQGGSNPMAGMMAGMAGLAGGMGADGEESAETPPNVPQIDGTFRIVTDGKILANNTDEGPQPGDAGQLLQWDVNIRTQSPPMALIELDQ